MTSDTHEDLQWLAFQYVTAELSGAEAAQFEDLLAHDQQAREAVAEAVDLTEAVTLVAGETLPLGRQRPFRVPLQWMALGAAACLIGVLLFQTIGRRSADTASESFAEISVNPGASDTGDSLVLAWAELYLQGSEQTGDEVMDWTDVGLASEDAEPIHSDAELVVPSWLYSATAIDPLSLPKSAKTEVN